MIILLIVSRRMAAQCAGYCVYSDSHGLSDADHSYSKTAMAA